MAVTTLPVTRGYRDADPPDRCIEDSIVDIAQRAGELSYCARSLLGDDPEFEACNPESVPRYADEARKVLSAVSDFARQCISCADRHMAGEAEIATFIARIVAAYPSSEGKDLRAYSRVLAEEIEHAMPSSYVLRCAAPRLVIRNDAWLPSVGQIVLVVLDEQRKVEVAVRALASIDHDAKKLAAIPAFREPPSRLEMNQQIPMDVLGATAPKIEVPTR